MPAVGAERSEGEGCEIRWNCDHHSAGVFQAYVLLLIWLRQTGRDTK